MRTELKKPLLASLCLVIAAAVAFCLWGCGYAKHIDPKLYFESSVEAAQEAARLHAADIGGGYIQINCCGSMRPLIENGDWVVIKATPYRDTLLGRAVVYNYRDPFKTDTPEQRMLHRLVSGNTQDGFIASGDNNPRSESWNRVTADNYLAEAVAIYRVDPHQ